MMEKARDVQEKKGNSIFTLISVPFVVLSVLFISLLFSILLELICMTWVWPEMGSSHSKEMLFREVQYLNEGAKKSLYDIKPIDMAESAAGVVHEALEYVGIAGLIRTMEQPPREGDSEFINNMRFLFADVSEYVKATITIIEVFVVRVVITCLSMPIFILYGIGALVDGLVERDRRKFGGGYETAWVYHKVKRGLKPTLVLSILIYLSMPVSVHPNYIFTPCAMLFGVFLFLTAATFKKYI